MNSKVFFLLFILFFFTLASCKTEKALPDESYVYYQVGFTSSSFDWRDTAFIVRTSNLQLIQQIESQLSLPVAERKLIVGAFVAGSRGYNKMPLMNLNGTTGRWMGISQI